MPTYADIISIGDELLYGQTLDTNAHWISGRMDEIGIKVKRRITVADDESEILKAFQESEDRSDIVLITGGLGPTKDDLTKPLLARYFNVSCILNESALADVTEFFKKAGRELTEANRQQAELPANCTKITNRMGTAPGMWFDERNTIFVSMPGVPYEMKTMMDEIILPRLKQKFVGGVIHHRIIKTIGIAESTLADKIADWEAALPPHMKLAYLPSPGQVKLRITTMGNDKDSLRAETNQQVERVLPLIEQYVYGYDNDEIESVIGQKLIQNEKTLAIAESCTGGYLSHMVTSIPGSSAYFKGSLVSYANEIKEGMLGVDSQTLEQHGAVSEEVVLQMAKNIRAQFNTEVGLAISGIAGPDGGTEEKPVGTVWIAYSDSQKTTAKKFNFSKSRVLNIKLSALSALNMFRIHFFSN
ncbi:competence/damage-inducible protein A [Marinoscillum furvescens]|uniref:CinA-like protein n=1 Tax=Marinoscillum furvescens DSM 4134 TaxID=1122208 RepID=A0A3D9L6V0_MARFU|nr:competence/damage-inducible protein A [Marinoscillum furvescens]REE02079.1 competence/damage-inducible protein cinA [Marinoscillum furvescens DSM 4134]